MNKLFGFFVFAFVMVSCSSKEEGEAQQDLSPEQYREMKKDLMAANKQWHEQEMMDIEDYVQRHNWKMTTTGSGLKYIVYQKADTSLPRAQAGQIAVINYSISLLNDSICYASEGEPDEFLIGMDNVESGLHEGITYMRKGEKARLIFASNLAFGLVGDMDQVPPQSPLIYDIELVDILDGKTHKPVGDAKNKNR